MKVIFGLGNPGEKYKHTRHNAGFLAVDFFLKSRETISCSSKLHGQICETHFTLAGQTDLVKLFLVKPQTFMNASGQAVAELVKFYKLKIETDILVIHDEIDLQFGHLKIAFDSGAAGHNGVKSIIESLGSQKFTRLRIGIDSRPSRLHVPTEEYVLQNFTDPELKRLKSDILPQTEKLMLNWLSQ